MLTSLKRFASKKGVGLAGAGLLMFSLGVLLFVLQMRTTAEGQGSGNTRLIVALDAHRVHTSCDVEAQIRGRRYLSTPTQRGNKNHPRTRPPRRTSGKDEIQIRTRIPKTRQ